jgi:hypothetical protein
MSGLPPHLARLARSISNLRDIQERTLVSLSQIRSSLMNSADVLSNLNSGLKKADSLQVKSLSVGTTLSKFTQKNAEVLSKLNGGFFENAEELLKNYSHGLRTNTEAVAKAGNKMRLTGQSTDLLREVYGDMEAIFGKGSSINLELLKSNENLAYKYGVTNESLLKALGTFKSEIATADFIGLGKGMQDLVQSVRAVAKDQGADMADRILKLLTSSDLQKLSSLGIQTKSIDSLIDNNISSGERIDRLINVLDSTSKVVNTRFKSDQGLNFTRFVMESQGFDSDTLTGILNLNDLLKDNKDLLNTIAVDTGKESQSILSINESQRKYYDMAIANVFPTILDVLPKLLIAQGASNLLGTLGAGASMLSGGRSAITGIIRSIIPWAGLITGIASVGLGVWELVNKSNDTNKKIQQVVENTTEPKIEKPVPNSFDALRSILFKSYSSDKASSAQLEVLKNIESELRELNRVKPAASPPSKFKLAGEGR